ncbi:Fes1-domain-containing protein [Aaosphaeria arxii CBS 175.79]|uniref:Fes1-domain-containing protein n=1 Tax=Aaosphaeria arxii CBS 175.79 TaxID=1450172 RepID=A0A6A5XR79_9PLEO|nr:Fes1-domain-containing protein [Aaosphaeria arxii CBS 175.79]KAF2015337.1 Fes1-domain-containing protein [Aaosphaeria arxii CBS 175.79]
MTDPALNNLLKWGLENSSATRAAATDDQPAPQTQLSADAVRALFGGKSDAQLMLEAMDAVESDEVDLENKLIAFDNFEQLVEGIDNANNLENLGLWTRLVDQMAHEEPEIRMYAAWCAGIAVQNNIKSQERLLILGAIPTLINLATQDKDKSVRKKAILALSSTVRNYQPALDETVAKVPAEFKPEGKLDAEDMASVDSLINKLRENVK